MKQALVDEIANAVLYEGYVLYPYRPSVKNRQRWTFGGLYPRAYIESQQGGDAWTMQTECLVRGDERTILHVKVRFLQLIARQVGQFKQPGLHLQETEEASLRFVDSLQVGARLFQAWQEASEREVTPKPWRLSSLTAAASCPFTFPGSLGREPIRDDNETIVGVLVRRQESITGELTVAAERVLGNLHKVRVLIENRTHCAGETTRDEAVMRCLVSTHTILGMENGEFVSQIDPPEEARALAADCRNIGTWPVLVGENGVRDTMLSSPIILYDYPQIARESPGDLFDGTEIDEILSLRIRTMTDGEKREAHALDEKVRALLQRTETLDHSQLRGLHGALRRSCDIPETT